MLKVIGAPRITMFSFTGAFLLLVIRKCFQVKMNMDKSAREMSWFLGCAIRSPRDISQYSFGDSGTLVEKLNKHYTYITY